jgi:hypothetical protein
MSNPIDKSTPLTEKNDLTIKLLALYDLNKSYIETAEKFLSESMNKTSPESRNGSLTREDIDRLYSHVFVLEHIAKLLYEEFLINKKGGLPKWPKNEIDRRKIQTHR